MKIALCFIISYDHVLSKESIWKSWIQPNADIINVYFYYKDRNKIRSAWIREHAIPSSFISPTTYTHVIPAYIGVLHYAYQHDMENNWFCMLTDHCCPIITPSAFRKLFFKHHTQSILSWRPAWWNPQIQLRANLAKLPSNLHFANDPWFTLTRRHVDYVLRFASSHQSRKMYRIICSGSIANESLFAIILYLANELDFTKNAVILASTHVTDWSRMQTSTSPHIFYEGNQADISCIEKQKSVNPYIMFIRKIHSSFPDAILYRHIMET